MGDTVIFLSAYRTTTFTKSKNPFTRKEDLLELLKKHHITYTLYKSKIISPEGVLSLDTEYDDVSQISSFTFNPVNEKKSVDDFDELINSTGACIKLLHAHSLLADPRYFQIEQIWGLQSFVVYIDDDVFQIDPIAFALNGSIIIAYVKPPMWCFYSTPLRRFTQNLGWSPNVGTTLFLPLHPDSLWEKNAQIVLTGKEAAFLESCITRSVMTRDSLLAFLIKNRIVCNSFADIPVNILPPHLQRDYLLAYEFSHFIYGAHVRYNVIYSNGTDEAMTSEFHTWRREFLQEPFDLEPILERVACNQALTSFCRSFLDAVNHNDLAAMDDLIVNRELQVKGVRAKLRKPGEYQYDPCRPIHFYPLDFRFNRANVIIQDILTGLEAERDV